MGTDKSLLKYHQLPQRYHLYGMLQALCEKVFISCNATQVEGMDPSFHIIPDLTEYAQCGPISGLLSAFSMFPGKDLLVTGCDYPFISYEEMERFYASVMPGVLAAAFYDERSQHYEPLLGFYAAASAPLLKEQFTEEQYSIQYFLQRRHAQTYIPVSPNTMLGVNTMEEYEAARLLL